MGGEPVITTGSVLVVEVAGLGLAHKSLVQERFADDAPELAGPDYDASVASIDHVGDESGPEVGHIDTILLHVLPELVPERIALGRILGGFAEDAIEADEVTRVLEGP